MVFKIFIEEQKGFDTQKYGGDEKFNFLIFFLESMGAAFDRSMIPPMNSASQLKRNIGRGEMFISK